MFQNNGWNTRKKNASACMHANVYEALERYHAILKPCPQCGKNMTPLGDPPDDPYLYCWDCKIKCDFKGNKLSKSC